jgi:membrane associated rhomboid family serine protease
MPLVAIPIRTETVVRRTPAVNILLIGVNLVAFLLFDERLAPDAVWEFRVSHLHLMSEQPSLHQFFTYQFLHADVMHLFGNMLFLWVFGNSVNAKMGDGPYLLFYLAGGVFAGWGHAVLHDNPLTGASGAVAAVTTAYLALFPRSHVTVLLWFFLFIHFFEVPAMIVIGLKIIVWDNIIAPSLGGSQRVAHHAHLAGYLFGFAGAMVMLLARALPRDQFDMLALWNRWRRRREMASALGEGQAPGGYGAMARTAPLDPEKRAAEDRAIDEIADLRARIDNELDRDNPSLATGLYEELLAKNPGQCLSEQHQLDVAREFYRTGRFSHAAAAFDRFVSCYPSSDETGNVRLLLGIICARDLRQYEDADRHLTRSLDTLRDAARRDQCYQWLKGVRDALGRPAPEPAG